MEKVHNAAVMSCHIACLSAMGINGGDRSSSSAVPGNDTMGQPAIQCGRQQVAVSIGTSDLNDGRPQIRGAGVKGYRQSPRK